MNPEDFQNEIDKNDAEKKSVETDSNKTQVIEQAKNQVIDAMVQSTKANMNHRENTTTKVDIQNDIAETNDINRAISAINNLAVLTLGHSKPTPSITVDVGQQFNEISKSLTDVINVIKQNSNGSEKELDAILKQLQSLQVAPDPGVGKSLTNIEKTLKSLDIKPQVNIPAPKVTVQGKDIDLSPLVSLLNNINDTLKKLPTDNDDSEIIAGLDAVQSSINNLTFPVPNYVLPFKDSTGKATQVQLDASGNVPISGSSGGGAVTIADGADTAEGATTDTSVTAGNAGTVSGKLRRISADVNTVVTNTIGLATVANQTNGNQQTKITNGTNIADVISNDTGYNGQVFNASTKVLGPINSSGTGAQILFANTDVRGYSSIKLVWTSVGGNLAATIQFAPNSGGTYSNSSSFLAKNSATGVPTNSGVIVNTIYEGPIINPYLQLNITALTSGTATAYLVLSSTPMSYSGVNIAGNKTNNNAAPGTANVGVISGVANAAIQTWTEGNAVAASMDLAGNTRVLQVAGTASLTNVASSASSVNLLVSNTSVKSRIIYNDSSAILYVKYGATASTSSFTVLVPANTLFEFPLPTYTGNVDGIWASATGNARITEVT